MLHFVWIAWNWPNVIAACQAKIASNLRAVVAQNVVVAAEAAVRSNYHHRLGNTDADPSHFTSFHTEMEKQIK